MYGFQVESLSSLVFFTLEKRHVTGGKSKKHTVELLLKYICIKREEKLLISRNQQLPEEKKEESKRMFSFFLNRTWSLIVLNLAVAFPGPSSSFNVLCFKKKYAQ